MINEEQAGSFASLKSFTLMGIYWHNRFGDSLPGPDIQVTPLLARWLYEHVDTSTNVRVHV